MGSAKPPDVKGQSVQPPEVRVQYRGMRSEIGIFLSPEVKG